MKSMVGIVILLFMLAHYASAQDTPVPARAKFRLFKKKLNIEKQADTLKFPALNDGTHVTETDTIKKRIVAEDLKSKLDSASRVTSISTADTLANIGLHKPAALQATMPKDSLKHKANGVAETLTGRSKELEKLLSNSTDSLPKSNGLNNIQEKLGNNATVDQPGLPTDLKLVNSNVQPQGITTPGLQDNQLKIPGAAGSNQPGLPNVKLPDQNTRIPNTTIPSVDAADKIKKQLPEIPDLAKPDSTRVAELKDHALEDERIKKYAEPVGEVADRASPYGKNLDSLNAQDAADIAAQEAELALKNTEAMKALNQKNMKPEMPVKDLSMIQRYKDKRIVKDEFMRKSKNVMNDKITSLTPQVKDQQKNLGKVKKLNASVPSVKNMKQKRTDPLKERPFYERIVPGVSLQTYSGNVFAIDLAPQGSYRINTPLSVGAGVLYRVGFDRKYSTFASAQGVYGFRTLADYRLFKGLFVHAEYEKINITKRYAYSDKLATPDFNSTYIGLGKRYPISRKFYGSLLALYKIEFGERLAGTTKFNLRVLIEYKTKKVRKATDIN